MPPSENILKYVTSFKNNNSRIAKECAPKKKKIAKE
jgi:hypothetical protein